MNEVVISDTGPLLHLLEIKQESQLKIFQQIIITEQVAVELQKFNALSSIKYALNDRLVVKKVTKKELDSHAKILSNFELHKADLSVIVLVDKLNAELVLTDDLNLRKALENLDALLLAVLES